MTEIHVALIEYASADGTEPDVILAANRVDMLRGVRDRLASFDAEGHDSADYFTEHEIPSSEDFGPVIMAEWLEGLHEAATVPWVSILPTVRDGVPAKGYVLR